MINKINSSLSKVDYILHVADIHIRNWKRHKEYKEVFTKLYSAVDKLPADSIVTVGGDIVHAKTDMSPELISMVTDFFTQLANRVPTIVIAGNHDTNLNNNQRLDALTPIVEALDHPNLFYLRDSGVYEIGNLAISVMSLLDPISKYPTIEQVELEGYRDDHKKVAMYHGTVANSKVDSGLNIARGLDWDTFAGFDLVLLGDIHKRQILCKEAPLMFYPGSLIQQSFGESFDGHGYALIDLTKGYDLSLIDIDNQYGFYTIDVVDGKLPTNLPLSAKTSVRLRTKNTSPTQLKEITTYLRRTYGIAEVAVNDLDRVGEGDSAEANADSIQLGDIRNPQVQRQLIADYLKDSNLDPNTLDRILDLSDQLNQQLSHAEIARGVVWKPERFEFSNMFSYGEGNVIDFTNLHGTCGLFAPNHTGKSAILDALCFCLFDYTSRASKADQVLNNKSDWFSCKFVFELQGHQYTISKRASRYTKGPLAGRLRVDIDFSFVNDEGEVISLNGEQRRDTDRIIQSYVGTFDDFILTALSMQGNSSNFVEKTQAERKELLANFLDLAMFDQLFELANKEVKTMTVLLENHQKYDYDIELLDQQERLESLQKKITTLNDEIVSVEGTIDQHNQKVNQLNKELLPVNCEDLDLDQLNANLDRYQQVWDRQSLVVDQACTLKNQTEVALQKQTSHYQELKDQFDLGLFIEYGLKKSEKDQVDNQLQALKLVVSTKLEKLQTLDKHEYDPNCSYCVNNVFVKDALATRSSLESDKVEYQRLLDKQQEVVQYLEANKQVVSQEKLVAEADQTKLNAERAYQAASSDLQNAVENLQRTSKELKAIKQQIDTYNANKQQLEVNANLTKQIEQQHIVLRSLSDKLKKLQAQHNNQFAEAQVCRHKIDHAKSTIKQINELLTNLTVYEAYCKAVSRDGIPFRLISRAVPFIQNYVNNILSQVVDFTVLLETDGKNINASIGYDGSKWPLELASGMERFVASLAIRIALIKTTNLPKPDFIAIDEGLGVLDSSNLNSMHMLFTYMKDVFKFSLIISHIDVVRDMVDHIINIDRREGFSHISC